MSSESPLRDGDPTGFSLIETLRWEPASGFLRLERHLTRMAGSADTLDFNFWPDAAHASLDSVAQGQNALRIRLMLSQDGTFSTTVQDFSQAEDTIWTLRLAATRLDSSYGLLRHKTTRRGFYDRARAEFSRQAADEVILLNERGEVCEGTITNVFVDDGGDVLLTPALACGLLPGILRAELLEQGKARETVLSRDDLYEAKSVFVGNSLRGLINTRLL